MMRNIVLESRSDKVFQVAGLATAVIASNLITSSTNIFGVGTAFPVGMTVAFINDAGIPEYHIITASAAPNQATTLHPIRTTASGGAGNLIYRIKHYGPWIFTNPTLTHDYIRPADYTTPPLDGTGDINTETEQSLANAGAQWTSLVYRFNRDEIAKVNSIRVKTPFQFVKAYGNLVMALYQYEFGVPGITPIITLGESGRLMIQDFDVELSLNNAYIKAPTSNGVWSIIPDMSGYTRTFLQAGEYDTVPTAAPYSENTSLMLNCVSFVNLPAVLQWRPFPLTISFNITHTKVLT